MNIAFLNSIEAETYGGMEEWIRLVAEGLAQRNHSVTLIGRPNSKFLKRGGASNSLNNFELDISGDFNPFTISALKKFLSEEAIDFIIVNFNKDIRIGGMSARWNKSTKVIWSVGLDITKDNLAHKLITPKLVDRVITPSQSLKNQIVAPGYIDPEIVDVIPIGIFDIDQKANYHSHHIYEKYNIPEDSLLSVTVGRLVDQKAHKDLIAAAPDIIKRHDNIRFLFLGDGPNESMLKKMIEERNIGEHFVFCGMLDSIDEELAFAHVMIHPSRVEPFGIAVLEGMRSGIPIAASRVGGIPEVVEENYNALLFEPENVDDIARVVLELLEDSDKLKTFGENGRKRFLDKFKYSDMIDRVEQSLLRV